MNLILIAVAVLLGGISFALWIKFKAANHKSKVLLEKLMFSEQLVGDKESRLLKLESMIDDLKKPAESQADQPEPSQVEEKSPKRRKYSRRPKK